MNKREALELFSYCQQRGAEATRNSSKKLNFVTQLEYNDCKYRIHFAAYHHIYTAPGVEYQTQYDGANDADSSSPIFTRNREHFLRRVEEICKL